MLDFFLPIAGLSVNLGFILAIGMVVGFVSGLFGVGGGFLMTPILIFLGIPPAIAVATGSAQLIASATIGVFAARRQRAINLPLAMILLVGALLGTGGGIWFFNLMQRLGHLEPVITMAYIVLLGAIGGFMMKESLDALKHPDSAFEAQVEEGPLHRWFASLPFRYEFSELNIVISLVPLLITATLIGFLGAVLGVGGGFMMVPALIYIFRVPIRVVVGTSQFQILFTMMIATILHATFNHAVDLVLAVPLIIGGVIGAHLGTLAGRNIKGAAFRLALAVIILAVALRFIITAAMRVIGAASPLPMLTPTPQPLPLWESWIASEAASNGLLYGLITAGLALGVGWAASRIFNRS